MPVEHAFSLLNSAPLTEEVPIGVLFGEDSVLRSWAKARLLSTFGGDDSVELDGEQAQWKDVIDELQTGSLFSLGQRRAIVIRDADKLVSKYRSELEDYVQKPSSAGSLILDLRSFPANTRLYKSIQKQHLIIQCSIPTSGRSSKPDLKLLREFLCGHVAGTHQCSLQKEAADTLIDLSGTSIGMLDTDIAKLAVCVAKGEAITSQHIHQHIGGWRSKTMWEIIDAAAEGNANEALRHLDHVMASGEKAFALLPQISWSLRRLGLAAAAIDHAERTGQRISMSDALAQAGFRPFDLKKAEAHLRKIGRPRAQRLLGWLLEADLKLKGSHSSDQRARWVLEELFLQIAT